MFDFHILSLITVSPQQEATRHISERPYLYLEKHNSADKPPSVRSHPHL